MTEQDFILVIALASTALVITLADLLFSWFRHRSGRARAAAAAEAGLRSPEEAAAIARREAVRRRLSAIQAAGDES